MPGPPASPPRRPPGPVPTAGYAGSCRPCPPGQWGLATMEKYIPTLEDNVFTSKPFLFAINAFGNVVTLDGGTQINVRLMYAATGNQGSYSGGDTFLTDEDEGTTVAQFG